MARYFLKGKKSFLPLLAMCSKVCTNCDKKPVIWRGLDIKRDIDSSECCLELLSYDVLVFTPSFTHFIIDSRVGRRDYTLALSIKYLA
jgi:hypothetical protein